MARRIAGLELSLPNSASKQSKHSLQKTGQNPLPAMAMSDTGSSLANWSDDLYHYAPSPGLSFGAIDEGVDVAADSTAVASAATTPTSPASAGSADGSPKGGIQLGPRAAGKPAASAGRKRARASRRAPVTMLNTDAANFRAMVQQFTGIPAPPAGPVISFGAHNNYGFHQQAPASVSFDHLHHQRQQQQYTGAAAFGYGNTHSLQQSLAGGVFAHGLGSAEDRMLLQSIQAAQMPGGHASNGYFA